MRDNHAQRVALVTGAARGIGRAIAGRLVTDGLQVVLADIDAEGATAAAAALGSAARPAEVDVADEPSVRKLLQEIGSRYERLDALINNAAVTRAVRRPLEQLELSEWNRVLATNLGGIFLCCKHAVPLLRASRGSIVNIASTRALQSEVNTEAYAASKGGVVALSHALAISLGPDIRVNCISPGWIHSADNKAGEAGGLTEQDHAQHPVGRVGRPEDIAALAAFLISDQAGFMTGQNVVADGGMTRRMIYVGD